MGNYQNQQNPLCKYRATTPLCMSPAFVSNVAIVANNSEGKPHLPLTLFIFIPSSNWSLILPAVESALDASPALEFEKSNI